MDLSIIIINWNSRDYVRECLRSIYSETIPFSMEVLVFDSGSKDGCAEMVQREFPEVRYYESDDNLGFARANNAAVTHARGDALLFLNPDTEVHLGALGAMYAVLASTPDAGAIGARLLNSDGTLQTSCVQAFPTVLNQVLTSNASIRFFPHSRLWGRSAIFQDGEQPKEVEAISGAAILMRRKVFEQVGRFCEEYFMYSEDIDLCFQASNAGYRNLYVPTARIVHHGGGSSAHATSQFSTIAKAVAVEHYFVRSRGVLYAAFYRSTVAISAVMRIFALYMRKSLVGSGLSQHSLNDSIVKWTFIAEWAWGVSEACVKPNLACSYKGKSAYLSGSSDGTV